MSPQLLLVMIVALITATAAGLVTRRPFMYLPIFWVIGVIALLAGQVIGRAAHINILTVGQVRLGAGLAVNIVMLAGLQLFSLWYNQGR